MALANRKTAILVGLEATYGVDAAPGSTSAILCNALTLEPLIGSSVERDMIRPYFGQDGSVRVENYAQLSFDCEIAGSGTAGTVPNWGKLLKASNYSETITAAPVIGACGATGTLTTIVFAAAASAVDDFYTGMTVAITAGTGIGQQGEIIQYVGATKTATIAKPWAVAPVITASTYSIGANVIYTPNSNFSTGVANTSVSIYFVLDGVRHILLGARGTASFDLSAKAIPKMKWKFTGLLGTISDSGAQATDFTGWQVPVTVSTANTTDTNLLGFNGMVMQTFNFDMGNNVVYRQLIGAEYVLINDRKTVGNVMIEANTVATKDWWTPIKNSLTGPLCFKHGQVAGNIFSVTAPKIQLKDPKYSDSDGVAMLGMALEFIPYSMAGNDELRICAK